jgi:adenine-specific DNA-methyltransferase
MPWVALSARGSGFCHGGEIGSARHPAPSGGARLVVRAFRADGAPAQNFPVAAAQASQLPVAPPSVRMHMCRCKWRRKSVARRPPTETSVETLRHPDEVTRLNIPTAETSGLMRQEEDAATPRLYPRNPDLDPQLVWRGKDAQDAAPLAVDTVPIYIQEKVKPEALIRDLRRQAGGCEAQANLFGDFDRIEDAEVRLDFYQHAENWSNRMILGDSLLVMNSLAEKEGLRGQVQMIYLDPPYGIRFASNWQTSTRKRQVEDGKVAELSREPEQIKAFRDAWRNGIHSYLAYLRDRFTVARDLLTDSGSIFVQIGDENVHLVRSLLDEIFGAANFVCLITVRKTGGTTGRFLPNTADYIIWFGKDKDQLRYSQLFLGKGNGAEDSFYDLIELNDGLRRRMTSAEREPGKSDEGRRYQLTILTSQRIREGRTGFLSFNSKGKSICPPAASGPRTEKV